MSAETKIPKVAVKPLAEYCQKQSRKTGKPAAEIFKGFLQLMKKHGGYFFGEPWPKKLNKHFEFSDADSDYVGASRDYREECERFNVVCLRRNMSLEGFDVEGFEGDFSFHGKVACWECVVPDAARLREGIRRVEEAVRENEEEMKMPEPSYVTASMFEHYKKANVVRSNRMMYVELRLYEEAGSARERSCSFNDKNKYRCPYGEEADELIKCGKLARFIRGLIQWYDFHWNPSESFRPSPSDLKWYHYGEPSVIDVTSYEDILEAAKDGRLDKIIEERKKYEREYKG